MFSKAYSRAILAFTATSPLSCFGSRSSCFCGLDNHNCSVVLPWAVDSETIQEFMMLNGLAKLLLTSTAIAPGPLAPKRLAGSSDSASPCSRPHWTGSHAIVLPSSIPNGIPQPRARLGRRWYGLPESSVTALEAVDGLTMTTDKVVNAPNQREGYYHFYGWVQDVYSLCEKLEVLV